MTLRFDKAEIEELITRNPDIKLDTGLRQNVTKRPSKDCDLPLGKESEEEFQSWVIKTLRENQWRVAHFRAARIQRANGSVYYQTPVQADGAGFPDLIAVHDESDTLLAIELKTKSGSLSPEQEKWMLSLAGIPGIRALVARPEDREKIIKIAGRRD